MSSIEHQVITEASKRLSDQIDFEVLCGMLCELGWTKVVLSPMTWEESAAIDLWVMKNVKHPHENMGLVWVFENSQDANWFILKWS